ncbi:MAG TPA: hypothetical protein ENK82_02795 [Campylobacterales bacterium]|nr:hypothetical protein [Campylobacterales bacterium]
MKFFSKVIVSIILLAFLGCGGGGGGSSSTNTSLVYEGKEEAITFNQQNAEKVIASFVNPSSLNQILSTDSTTNKSSNRLQKQAKVTNGSVSGTVDTTTTKLNNETYKVVAKFNNYSDGLSETMTGTVIYTILYEDFESSIIKKMDMDIDLLTLKSSSDSMLLDGLIVAHVDNSTGNVKYIYNTVTKDNETQEMSKFENFEVLLDSQNRPFSYKGKVYYSKEGYVLVSTPIKLSYTGDSETADVGGEIHFEGQDAIVKERIAYDNRIRVEIDYAKDGTVDELEVYNATTMESLPNAAPVVAINFPKEIFTNSDLSTVYVQVYDPDLDEVSTSYQWMVNDVEKSTTLSLSNQLYVKHDTLKLIVNAQDNRVGDQKQTQQSKTQKVLNSRPVITASFEMLNLEIGQTHELAYSVSDADNDDLKISWDYVVRNDSEALTDYLNPDTISCLYAIQEYDSQNSVKYENLTFYEQEDFNRSNCVSNSFETDNPSYDFVSARTYTAGLIGYFGHELIVDDGEYNRSKKFGSVITQMDLIESQDYHHEAYTYNEVYPIYMKDMNNDNHQDLVYIKLVEKEEVIEDMVEPNGNVVPGYTYTRSVPNLIIEYREGQTILNQAIYELEDFDNYFIHDLNGNGKLDILFTYENINDTSDNTAYGKMLQNSDTSFSSLEQFSLDNRQSLAVANLLGDRQEEIIIMKATNYQSSNEVKIVGKDDTQTVSTSLPVSVNHQIMKTELLVSDMDSNGKKDIIVVNKTQQVDASLNFTCSILSQALDGSFSEKVYDIVLKDGLKISDFEKIQNVQIVTLNNQENIWIAQSAKHLFLLKLENDTLNIIQTLEYDSDYPAFVDIVDINHDLQDDIVLRLNETYSTLLHLFIQKENFEFLSVQEYNFTNVQNGFTTQRESVLGDIDKDGKYELFVSTSEENLSVLYFK